MDRKVVGVLITTLWLAGCVHLPEAAQDESATDQGGEITNTSRLAAIIEKQHVHPLDPAAGTPLLDQAMIELAKTDDEHQFGGITYDLTKDNSLDSRWLLQSPNIWGRHAASIAVMPLDCKGRCDPDFHLPFCRRNSDCGGNGAVFQLFHTGSA